MSAQPHASTSLKVAPAPRQSPLAPASRSLLASVARGSRAVVPYVSYGAQRLGRLGIVGVAFCVFSAVVVVTTLTPLREQIASELVALDAAANAGDAATAGPSSAAPETSFDAFLGQLPTRTELPELMGQIVSVSEASGVALEEGTYELAPLGSTGRIARYQLKFPVVGTYPRVRSFIDQALVTVPAMSLESLRLERDDIAQAQVSAELDFAVFVRTQ